MAQELLVSSIEEVVADYGLSESFIGVILLPIVGMPVHDDANITIII